MDRKKVTVFFQKAGFKLRPKSCELIAENYVFFERAERFLTRLLDTVRKILADKNDAFNTFVEPDVAEEAVFILRKESNTLPEGPSMQVEAPETVAGPHQKGDPVVDDHLVILSNFDGHHLRFDPSSAEVVPTVSKFEFGVAGRTGFEKAKYLFLRHLLEQTGRFFFEHSVRDNALKKTKLSEIGSLKGMEGSFTIFGVLFQQAGEFFVQDLLTSLRVSFLHCRPTQGYLAPGSFVLLTGSNHDSIFLVDSVTFPDFSSAPKVEKHVLFRAAFHRSINREIQGLTLRTGKPRESSGRLRSGEAFIRNLGPVLAAKGDDFSVRIANNFNLMGKNTREIEAFLLDSHATGTDLLVLSGPFFREAVPRNSEEKEEVMRAVARFVDALKKVPERENGMMLLLVPDVSDAGLQTFPKKPLSESVWTEVGRAYPNSHFCENPCHFMVRDKTFLVSKTNMIIKLLRNSVAPVDAQTPPSVHLSRNLFGQRDLLPFTTQEYVVPPQAREKLMLYETPDFLVVCDDLAGCHESVDVQGKRLVFPGNFSHSHNFAAVRPFRGTVEFGGA